MIVTETRPFSAVAREAINVYGANRSSLTELVAVVLGNTVDANTCQEIAQIPVNRLLTMSTTDFMKYEGVGRVSADRLVACVHLAKRFQELSLDLGEPIRSPDDGARLFEYLRHESQEHFVVAFLNVKNKVIAKRELFVGSLNASVVHPREIFREAVAHSSASIIVCHNHPSGDTTPSPEDVEVTKRLYEAGKLIGVELIDHVIIGSGRYTSLKEKGYF